MTKYSECLWCIETVLVSRQDKIKTVDNSLKLSY